MKLRLSLKLRAALLATILTCSSYTLPVAWAKGVAETRAELERTTLTELSQETPSLSPIESAYTLEETTAEADILHITKYLWDERNLTLTPVVYNVNITPLGSDASFNWEKDTETGQLTLVEQLPYDGTSDVRVDAASLRRLDVFEEDVSRNFVGIEYIFTIDSNSFHTYGGALSHTYTRLVDVDIIGHFIGNSSAVFSSSSIHNYGGAIFSRAEIGSITGDFIGNSVSAFSGRYASTYGGAIFSRAGIGSIKGDFIGNYAYAESDVSGGAIHSIATITTITGDFIANYATASPSDEVSADVRGGAIYSSAKITNITGDFIANYATTAATTTDLANATANVHGGAINSTVAIDSITGDFIGNYVSNGGNARAGAIWTRGEIKALRAHFINNYASGFIYATGGAIYNQGQIQFLADKSDILITGNYTTTDGGVTKSYEAIYNEFNGLENAIHFNAYEGYSIVLNDAISGGNERADAIANQILHINQVMEGTETLIDPSATTFSTVYFNNKVENHTINVHAGELVLGSFAGEGEIPAAHALLENSVLDIKEKGHVITDADYIASSTSVTLSGSLSLHADGIGADTLTAALFGTGTLNIKGAVNSNASIATNTLSMSYTGSSMSDSLKLQSSARTTVGSWDLTVAGLSGNSWTLLSWDDGTNVLKLHELMNAVTVNGEELYKGDYSIKQSGNSYVLELNTPFQPSVFNESSYTDVSFREFDLRYADLSQKELIRADFSTLFLKDASFAGSNLTRATFTDAYLVGVSFENAIINGANFSSTRADDEDISTDQIRSTASYQNKDLSDVGFRGVNLDGLDMQGFNLQGTNFTDTGILASQIERADLRGTTLDSSFDLSQLNAYVTTTGLGDQLIVRNGKLGGALTLYSSTSPSTVQLSDALTLGAGDSLTLQAGQSLYVTMTGSLLVESGSNASINIESALPRSAEWTSEAFITWQSGADILSTDALAAILLINGSSLEDLGLYLSLDNNSYAITNTKPAPDSYTQLSSQGNGGAGGELLDELIQQGKTPSTDIQNVLATLDDIFKDSETGNAESDRLLAAVAGAGVTSLGSAALSNIEGQLTRMRNRAAGLIPAGESQFWISAEAGRNELSGAGTAAGHNINNWGGSVGADWGVAEHCSLGFAFTALYGDLNASSVDSASGELDSYYLSLTTQHQSGKWSHQAAISWGLMDASLDRHISHANGSYSTSAETDGYSYGVMYELGYDIKLSESSTLTPIFNAALIHSYLDGYTETGSDAALRVDAQDNTIATFGIGARVASKLDFGLQVGARALFKADAGDRTQQADVSIASVSGSSARIEGTEAGSFGVELGIGASMPVSDSSALFLDTSVEMREKQQDYRASVGYKLDF